MRLGAKPSAKAIGITGACEARRVSSPWCSRGNATVLYLHNCTLYCNSCFHDFLGASGLDLLGYKELNGSVWGYTRGPRGKWH